MEEININLYKRIKKNRTETLDFTDGNVLISQNGKVTDIDPADLFSGDTVVVQSDWNEEDSNSGSYIKNKPTIPTKTSDLDNDEGFITQSDIPPLPSIPTDIKDLSDSDNLLFDKDYNSLNNKPENLSDFNNDLNLSSTITKGGETNGFTEGYLLINVNDKLQEIDPQTLVTGQAQADWIEEDSSSGAYIKNKPSILTDIKDLTDDDSLLGDKNVQSDWNAVSGDSFIKNKPNLFDGDYNSLSNLPDLSALADIVEEDSLIDFPAIGKPNTVYIAKDTGYMYRFSSGGNEYVQLTDQTAIWGQISGSITDQNDLKNALAERDNVQSDWNESDINNDSFIKNKPTIPTKTSDLTNDSGFITSANIPTIPTDINQLSDDDNLLFDKQYSGLTGTPTKLSDFNNDLTTKTVDGQSIFGSGNIPVGDTNVQSDWDAVSGDSFIKNKPSIPTKTSDLTNDEGFITLSDLPNQTTFQINIYFTESDTFKYIAPYSFKINTIDNTRDTLGLVIKVNDLAYTLGNTISQFDLLSIESDGEGFIILNCEKV